MEEGSLLQTALQHSSQQTDDSGDLLQRNCLWLDIFAIDDDKQQQDHNKNNTNNLLLFLAELAVKCNAFFQSRPYKWHYGGDGPVFGVHVTNGVPHLRAYCRYGPSVLDEWMAISYLRELTTSIQQQQGTMMIAGMAWDVQDGQVMLIQLADLLPEWLDEDSSDNQRFSCWLVNGNLQLLRKSHLSLRDALQHLRKLGKTVPQSSTHPMLQKALLYWLELNQEESKVSQQQQRTPMVLPRKVARFFQSRPELIHTAIQAFCQYLEAKEESAELIVRKIETKTREPDLTKYEDWVWTVQRISRTNFAMTRTMISSKDNNNNNDWSDANNATPVPVGVEVKRLQRTCRNDSSPHLKHAVSFGVRVMVGLELLLLAQQQQQQQSSTVALDAPTILRSVPLPSIQERILYWNRIEAEASSSNNNNKDEDAAHGTLLQSFQQGPNHAQLDLTNVLKCPVFPEESCNLTLCTAPEVSLRDQIQLALKQYSNSDDSSDSFPVPRQDQVDGEEWMDMMAASGASSSVDTAQDLDGLLSRFQAFMNQKSEVGGVASSNPNQGCPKDSDERVEIRPRVFMNILHAVLKGEQLSFPAALSDPFFYDEDYDLMEDETGVDGDDEQERGNEKSSNGLVEIMGAMDRELSEKTESRRFQVDDDLDGKTDEAGAAANGDGTNDAVAEDMHVLSNLMQSLEASGGGSGPVGNMIKEMEGASRK
ncbi:MAG: hypothetical protein SGILL_009947 [Bacillariaceae sp.]